MTKEGASGGKNANANWGIGIGNNGRSNLSKSGPRSNFCCTSVLFCSFSPTHDWINSHFLLGSGFFFFFRAYSGVRFPAVRSGWLAIRGVMSKVQSDHDWISEMG